MNLEKNVPQTIQEAKDIAMLRVVKAEEALFNASDGKTIEIGPHPSRKKPIITNLDAYHFSIGSILGDGSIHLNNHNLQIEQRSAHFAMWKRGIAMDTGLIPDHSSKGNYKKKWKLAHGQIILQLPLTMKGRMQKNGPGKKAVYRRGWAFTTSALYHDPKWRNLFYKEKTDKFAKPGKVEYRKSLPPDIKDYFWGNLALAIFYLDDGWYDWEKKTARFSTGEFTREECELLVDAFKVNFNIDSVVYPKTGKPHHIFIKRTSYPEIYHRVYPFVADLSKKHPRYALNKAMKNKVLPEPTVAKIGRPKKKL